MFYASHVKPPPAIENVVWIKYNNSSAWNCRFEIPGDLGLPSLNREALVRITSQMAEVEAASMKKAYKILFGTCFLGVFCLSCCVGKRDQSRLRELMDELKEALGSEFDVRTVCVLRSDGFAQNRSVYEDIWLGIAYGAAAIEAMNKVESKRLRRLGRKEDPIL